MNVSQPVLLRRMDVLAALAEGHTQAETAKIVGVSTRTVQRVVALDRLRAAVPPDQMPDALKAALEQEKNARRRAGLLHDLAAVVVAEARTLRRTLRSSRGRHRGHASVEQGGELPPVVRRPWPGLDDSPESLEKIQAAARWGISLLRSTEQ